MICYKKILGGGGDFFGGVGGIFFTAQYSTVQYSTIQYNTVQYSTQYSSRSRMYSSFSFSSSFAFSRLEVGSKRRRRRRREEEEGEKVPSVDPRSSWRGPWVKMKANRKCHGGHGSLAVYAILFQSKKQIKY